MLSTRTLAWLFFPLLLLGCSGGSASDGGCSEPLAAAAVNQVEEVLSDAGACQTASDCVLVRLPCGLTACGLSLAAVNQTNQSEVEHAFSVMAAETCRSCELGVAPLAASCTGPVLTTGQQAGATCGAQGICMVYGSDGGGF